MDEKLTGNWMRTSLHDLRCKPFSVGDKVVRAVSSGRAVNIEIAEVTRIDGEKMYLSSSKVPVNYPGRLLIVTELFRD